MKLSRSTIYAIEAVVQLARSPTGAPISSGELAAASGMPVRYLLTILGKLTRKGILASRRGLDGGYLLARPPVEITLLELVEAVEGPLTQLCREPDLSGLGQPASMRGRGRQFHFSADRSATPNDEREESADSGGNALGRRRGRNGTSLSPVSGTSMDRASSTLTRMARDWLASIHIGDLIREFRVVDSPQPASRERLAAVLAEIATLDWVI